MSEPPVSPKPPQLGDFGLSAESIKAISTLPITIRLSKIAGGFWLIVTVGLMVACSRTSNNDEGKGIFLLWALSGSPLMLIDWLVKPWEQLRTASQFGIDLKKLTAYRESEALHRKRKAEFDEWFGRSQRAFWLSLSPNQFEQEVGRLYRRLGYSARVTKQSRDGGVDVILRAEHGTTIVQCKAHQRKIGVKPFRELHGVMADFGAESAILVCLHGATGDAWKFIQGKPIRVVMLNDLVRMSRELADDIGNDVREPSGNASKSQ
jgi:Restriction endonuclease